MKRSAALAVVMAVTSAAPAYAETCALAVALEGDAQLVATLGAELAGRGIEIRPTCTDHTARVERRGDALAISIIEAAHAPVERVVRGMKTAAAVVESYVRDDVGTPLLEVRTPSPRPPAPAETPSEAPKRSAELTGVHVFGVFESSVANDGTAWGGMHVGACIMVGRLCAGGRLRGSTVSTEDKFWSQTRRKSGEMMVGLDVPFRLRRFLLTPGAAAGVGDVTTGPREMRSRSANFRAEAHVAFSVPLSKSFALDLSVVGTLAQQVKREPGYMDDVPAEPFGFLRFGVGVRWGRR
ncbi:MAG: hypothetical protein SFX73_08050 [Kofleriaceae bacterium]|nr:hypothetical protein [Kofleriaceae bacterium]